MPSALFYVARARPCFNHFKELTHKCLVKAYPFKYCPSVNFVILGNTIQDDILHKCFGK